MKHYIDIQNIRETNTELVSSNTGAFVVGDMISITEKLDGSNASFTLEDNVLKAFSRKQELNFKNTLDGFWEFIQTLNPNEFQPSYIYFGEWLRKNKVLYSKESMHHFYLFDVYNKETQKWMSQEFVKAEAEKHHLIYVPELYYGPFISWEHCRSFMNSPKYGDTQEGIVVKNVSKLNYDGNKNPVYLKIVNESFKETKKVKILNPEKEEAKAKSYALLESIVTERRVEKMIFKLRDEGILPEKLKPEDMKLVAQNLPKRVYEDCIKEEPETVNACDNPGKIIASLVMKHARTIILGG